jgi:hypothetical protein
VLCAALVAAIAITPSYVYRAYTEDRGVAVGIAHIHRAIETSPVRLALAGLAQEQQCLAEAMYYEARGEGVEGQKAIAEVVLQRTHDHNFPSTICGVVYQGADVPGHICQFSFACDGELRVAKAQGAWQHAKVLADAIMTGAMRLVGETGHAVAFHSVDVTPVWAATMIQTTQIGNHIFYRWNPHPAAEPASAEAPAPAAITAPEAMPVAAPPQDPTSLPDTDMQPVSNQATVSQEVQPHV